MFEMAWSNRGLTCQQGFTGKGDPVRVRLRWMILVLLAAGVCRAQTPRGKTFVFWVFADPQMGMYTHDHGFARETQNLEAAIHAANRRHPAFIVVCGDLVNKPQDAAEIHGYLQAVHQLQPGIPLYNVAGNHDVSDHPTPALLEAYRKVFGRDWYSFRYRDLEGIVLDSQLISHGEQAPLAARRQKAWLLATLAQARRDHVRHIVVFQHIPWFLNTPGEADSYFNIPRRERPPYLKLFKESGVRYIFAGHYHRNARGQDQGVHMITSGPVGKPLGKDPSGFTRVVVTAGGLKYTYVPLSSLSEGSRKSLPAATPPAN